MPGAYRPSAAHLAAHAANRTDRRAVRRFLVVGPHAVSGARKGEEVSLSVTPEQAEHLIAAGHVVEVKTLPALKNQADELEAATPEDKPKRKPSTARKE